MTTTDPLDRARKALEQAARERDELHNRADTARVEKQHLQRRLEIAEQQNRDLMDRNADLMDRVAQAEQRAEAHKRALAEHSGRARATKKQ